MSKPMVIYSANHREVVKQINQLLNYIGVTLGMPEIAAFLKATMGDEDSLEYVAGLPKKPENVFESKKYKKLVKDQSVEGRDLVKFLINNYQQKVKLYEEYREKLNMQTYKVNGILREQLDNALITIMKGEGSGKEKLPTKVLLKNFRRMFTYIQPRLPEVAGQFYADLESMKCESDIREQLKMILKFKHISGQMRDLGEEVSKDYSDNMLKILLLTKFVSGSAVNDLVLKLGSSSKGYNETINIILTDLNTRIRQLDREQNFHTNESTATQLNFAHTALPAAQEVMTVNMIKAALSDILRGKEEKRPNCFNCGDLGHLSKDCPKHYCGKCWANWYGKKQEGAEKYDGHKSHNCKLPRSEKPASTSLKRKAGEDEAPRKAKVNFVSHENVSIVAKAKEMANRVQGNCQNP